MSVAGVLTAVVLIFGAGAKYDNLTQGHKTDAEWNVAFDSRLSLHIAPFLEHNRGCAVNFARIESSNVRLNEKLDDIMTYLMEHGGSP